MLRWIVKKALLCFIFLAIFYYLNNKNPQWMQNIGRWIGGEVGNRVSVAVSDMLDRAEEKTGLGKVLEVFGEGS